MNLLIAHQHIVKKSSEKGFTLIELLVVIGILGILAASLVATIDPFEQIKKANDSKVQNIAVEFQTANIRYFAAQNNFPWEDASTAGTTCKGAAGTSDDDITTPILLNSTRLADCLDGLIQAGELKSGFKSVTGALDKIYVSEKPAASGGSSVVQVCYKPTSLGGQRDKAAKWEYVTSVTPPTFTEQTTTGTGSTVCTSLGGSLACYWCTQ